MGVLAKRKYTLSFCRHFTGSMSLAGWISVKASGTWLADHWLAGLVDWLVVVDWQ